MADTEFSNVRVEAHKNKSAMLRWSKSGTVQTDVKVYRSTDGSSFAAITSAMLSSVLEYEDLFTLEDGTKYWYKLSQDDGSTFSDVVTVVSYRASSAGVARQQAIILPDDAAALARRQEQANITSFGFDTGDEVPCPICIVDGAIVLDCGECNTFRVLMTEDINSITIIGCDPCPRVEFVIPAETERGICGWPVGCDRVGDECTDARIPGGPEGRTALTNGLSYKGYPRNGGAGNGRSGTGGGDTGSCPCETVFPFHIQCCDDDCTLDCDVNTTVKLKACGGIAPYVWDCTDGIISVADGLGRAATLDTGLESAHLSAKRGEIVTATLTEDDCDADTSCNFTINAHSSGCSHFHVGEDGTWLDAITGGGVAPFQYEIICPENCTTWRLHQGVPICPNYSGLTFSWPNHNGWGIGLWYDCSNGCGDAPSKLTIRVTDAEGHVCSVLVPHPQCPEHSCDNEGPT